MKRFIKEIIIILFLQLLMFYLFPLTAGPTDTMGMVILIIFSVFILSLLIGVLSKEKVKYLYPVLVAIVFIPSIFIYYNESALIYSVWFFIISFIGLFIGLGINKIKKGSK